MLLLSRTNALFKENILVKWIRLEGVLCLPLTVLGQRDARTLICIVNDIKLSTKYVDLRTNEEIAYSQFGDLSPP